MYQSIFKILASIYREAGITCILIGGYAVNSYKVSRHTADVDFLLTKDSFLKIKDRLIELGYSIENEQEVFVQLINKCGLRDLDFMFADSETIEKLIKSSNTTIIASETFIIPSLQNLIALKLHSIKYNPQRELNDLPDIINLIKNNKLDAGSPEIVLLCEKFGPIGIYEKIRYYLEKDNQNEK
jgi:hypothetical protein